MRAAAPVEIAIQALSHMVTTLISMVAVARSDWGALAKTAISRAERAPPSGVDEAAPPGEEALLDAQQAADARVN